MASIIKVDQIQENTTGAGNNFSNNGSATTPTISIGNQTNKGLYHLGTDKLGIAIAGQRVGEIGSDYGGFTGNVIQIVQGQTNTQITNSTTTYNSTGLSVSITPKYNTSKILIYYVIGSVYSPSAAGMRAYIYKNGTQLTNTYQDLLFYTASSDHGNSSSFIYLDSPATTSTTTYAVYFNSRNGSGTIYVQYNNSYSTIICAEVQQ